MGPINEVQIKASEYLMDTAHSFRVHLKTYLQGVKTKNNPNPPPVEKPTVITIWIAKTFPAWQSCILTAMKKHFEVNKKKLYTATDISIIIHDQPAFENWVLPSNTETKYCRFGI